MGDSRNDGPFEAVLHQTGNIDLFVDEFFSFLARRTDFFVVSPPEGGRLGFPPGMAAKLVISKFKKWQDFGGSAGAAGGGGSRDVEVPEPIDSIDVEVETEPSGGNQNQGTSAARKNVTTTATPPEKKKNKKVGGSASLSSSSSPADSPILSDKAPKLSDSYNGRMTDKYSWSQSIKDLDVHIAVGKEVKTKRDLEVKILGDRLVVKTPSMPEPVVADWKLSNGIIKDESYWSLHPGESVFFSLQKVREMWWDHIFEGEEAIDRTKIEAVRPMDELDDEEQAKIHELVYNQEQKLKGLPTTEQTKLEEVMKTAWDAEGSPFKGQPFDPTRVQLANNSINQ